MNKVARARNGSTVNVNGESPISWHVKYQTDGFEQNLIVRGSEAAEVLDRSLNALSWIRERGATPWNGYGRNGSGAAASPPAGDPATTICPVHSVPMESFSNERGSWMSHKAVRASGEEYWCKGKPAGDGS